MHSTKLMDGLRAIGAVVECPEAPSGFAFDPNAFNEFVAQLGAISTAAKKPPKPKEPDGIEAEFNERFWPLAFRKVGKGAAYRAYRSARRMADAETILAAWEKANKEFAGQFSLKKTKEFIPHPSTWLNSMRWEDEGETLDEQVDQLKAKPMRQFYERQRDGRLAEISYNPELTRPVAEFPVDGPRYWEKVGEEYCPLQISA